MKLYKCDRCGNFINENDIYKISEFDKPMWGDDGKKLITEFDFCKTCADEWDTMMLTIKEVFLRQYAIAVIKDKPCVDNCDMNLFDPEKEENKND